MTLAFTDSHAHLDFDQYDQDREETLNRASTAQVENILQIALGPTEERLSKCYNIVRHRPHMSMAVGLHPHDADKHSQDVYNLVKKYAVMGKVVAIGEIGLDYYYQNSDRENQKRCFSTFIDLALELKKPICVHTRDAFDDTFSILQQKNIMKKHGGVIHCFTGTADQAKKFMELGAYISFSGIVTFKNSTEVQEAAKVVPIQNMLIETDSPFLAPIPHRGKRNEPAYVVEVAKTIATLKGCSVSEIAEATTANAKKLFQFS